MRSLHVTNLEHIKTLKYLDFVVFGLDNVLRGSTMHARLNGVYWLVLPLLAAALGLAVWRALARLRLAPGHKERSEIEVRALALPILASFNALVSVFNQTPFYLYLTGGLTLASLLWMAQLRALRRPTSPASPRGPYLAAVGLCLVGVYYHAGQPYTRSILDVMIGVRSSLVQSELERNSLWIDPAEAATLGGLVTTIQELTDEDDTIFAFPNDAEVYFLADRRNPFRLFNPTLGLVNEQEVDAFLDDFAAARPKLLVHGQESAYNTRLTERLLRGIEPSYRLYSQIGGFAVYRLAE